MKKLILIASTIFAVTNLYSQGFSVQHSAQSTDGDINLLLGKPASTNTTTNNTYQNTHNNDAYQIYQAEEKSITIKNASYKAKTVSIYVQEYGEWQYIQNARIPSGRKVSYEIGQYEYPSNYGYAVHPIDEYTTINRFHSEIVTLY